MTVTRVTGTSGSNSGTTVVPTYSTIPTAGNVLIYTIAAYKNGSTTAKPTTPNGWVFDGRETRAFNAVNLTVLRFHKVASGNDTVPSLSLSAADSHRWIIEEFSGLDTTSLGLSQGISSSSQAGSTNTTRNIRFNAIEGEGEDTYGAYATGDKYVYSTAFFRFSTAPTTFELKELTGTSVRNPLQDDPEVQLSPKVLTAPMVGTNILTSVGMSLEGYETGQYNLMGEFTRMDGTESGSLTAATTFPAIPGISALTNSVSVVAAEEEDTGASYIWSWGDSSESTDGYSAVHAYDEPGTYTVTLTTYRAGGAVEESRIQVVING